MINAVGHILTIFPESLRPICASEAESPSMRNGNLYKD